MNNTWKPYTCKVCKKRFKIEKRLAVHALTHAHDNRNDLNQVASTVQANVRTIEDKLNDAYEQMRHRDYTHDKFVSTCCEVFSILLRRLS